MKFLWHEFDCKEFFSPNEFTIGVLSISLRPTLKVVWWKRHVRLRQDKTDVTLCPYKIFSITQLALNLN